MAIWKKQAKQGLTLVLGGGGARGLSHLGVLRVIEREEIPVSLIVGTSMGAIIGGMYAQHPNVVHVQKRLGSYLMSDEFKATGFSAFRSDVDEEGRFAEMWDHVVNYVRHRLRYRLSYSKTLVRPGVFDPEPRDEALRILLDDSDIEQCAIPFAAVATDLISGEGIALTKGNIRVAVAASMSIPGVLPPVELGGKLLVDGGATHPVPVQIARELGAKRVVAVDVGRDLTPVKRLKRGYSIFMRAEEISNRQLAILELLQADIVIRPKVGNRHWSEFEHARTFVRLGEDACEAALPAIREMLDRIR